MEVTLMNSTKSRRTAWLTGCAAFAALVLAVVGVKASAYISEKQQESKFESDMRISKVNAPSHTFQLTDQHGMPFSLDQVRGKVVVLQFMDPECTDICPIISAELVEADKHLGANMDDVAFVAVNVNQYHAKPSDLAAFSHLHGLDKLPNWHFVTGTTKDLEAVWKAYGIYVKPSKDGDVVHSDFIFFIDKAGQERYIAMPTNDNPTIAEWGQGIAFYAKKLL
jgi:cytochrome oxidase Cu insertion factor (SCO1/SenC/PrrC family)